MHAMKYLSCLVALSACAHSGAYGQYAAPTNINKFRESELFESINVGNSPSYTESGRSGLKRHELIPRDRSREFRLSFTDGARSKRVTPQILGISRDHRRFEWEVFNCDIGPENNVVGGSLTSISYGDASERPASLLPVTTTHAADANVGAQLAFRACLGPSNESPCGPPKKSGGESQNYREDRDHSLGVNPSYALTPHVGGPFLPVFGLGALTFIFGMFAGGYVYDRGSLAVGWNRYLLRILAGLIIGLAGFSFAFGFPWAAFF